MKKCETVPEFFVKHPFLFRLWLALILLTLVTMYARVKNCEENCGDPIRIEKTKPDPARKEGSEGSFPSDTFALTNGLAVTPFTKTAHSQIQFKRRESDMGITEVIATPGNRNTDHVLVEEIPLVRIQPSKANPRRRKNQAALAELAESIQQRGVLQPILVRPLNGDGYEIVCGERRYEASRTAQKKTIPARIVHLSDTEALELAVIENVQREDVHELDEALGYQALMRQNPERYTVDTLAQKIGRSPKYIYARLKLADLTPNLQAAFYEGKLTVGHANEIARLEPKYQERALQECFPGHRTTKAILKDKDPRPISVRELREWIEREIHLSLVQAPFDANDPNLVPAAGPCSTCPKRSGSNPLLFADSIRKADVCVDPECYGQKEAALVTLRLKEIEATGEKPVKVSESFVYYGRKPLPGVLYRPDYSDAKAGDCPTTTTAVVVEGKRAGTKLYICTDKKCRTHALHRTPLTVEQKAERKKQALALRVQQACRKRLLEEVYKRVPNPLSRHELDLLAVSYFQQLGHDSQHRLFKFFVWDEAKPKSPNGGYVEYLKIASGKLDKMSTAEIGKFLMACALAGELYCPTYISGATLAKDSALAREAVHYKINTKGILREVTEKLAKKPPKQEIQSKRPPSRRLKRKPKDG
jgi:ParB family transcriptional regulator, chromosome partitioning protein